LNFCILSIKEMFTCMQDCVAEGASCQGELTAEVSAYNTAKAALSACLNLVGDDPTASGVLGAAAASLVAVEVARLLWRRCHPEGPDFPLDR
jgi:hypothetical protein